MMKWLRKLLQRDRCSRQELAFLLKRYPAFTDEILDMAIVGFTPEAILRSLTLDATRAFHADVLSLLPRIKNLERAYNTMRAKVLAMDRGEHRASIN